MDTSDIKKGLKLMIDNQPCTVVDFQFVKPGKGQAFTRTKVQNLLTGAVLERTWKSGEKLDPADVEDRELQYIYPDGSDFVFMDPHTGEQCTVAGDRVGDDSRWLADGMTVSVTLFNGQPIGISLPISVTLQVVSSGIGKQTKPATLSTGAIVEVPLFVNDGDWVKIGTQTGSYIERVNRKA